MTTENELKSAAYIAYKLHDPITWIDVDYRKYFKASTEECNKVKQYLDIIKNCIFR